MPADVALEMLCVLGARRTNRERKTYWQARQRVYCSTLTSKAVEAKLAHKLRDKSVDQLAKWLGRSCERRERLQSFYQHLQQQLSELPAEAPITAQQLQARMMEVDFNVSALDVFYDAVMRELQRRGVAVHESRPVVLSGTMPVTAPFSRPAAPETPSKRSGFLGWLKSVVIPARS